MDLILNNLIETECFVYIDYVTIFSKSAEEYAARLENVLEVWPGKPTIAPWEVRVRTAPNAVPRICPVRKQGFPIRG